MESLFSLFVFGGIIGFVLFLIIEYIPHKKFSFYGLILELTIGGPFLWIGFIIYILYQKVKEIFDVKNKIYNK